MKKRCSPFVAQITKNHITARGKTWIFLDELRNIGNLPGLDKLLTEGRSRGARVAVTFQDIDGLREVYGERVAEEIVNQCDTMSYLRCRGTTAKWAAERVGRSEYWEKDFSEGISTNQGSPTFTKGSGERKNLSDAVLKSELSGLPSSIAKQIVGGRPGGYLQGWHVIPAIESVYPTKDRDAWYPFEDEGKAEDERFKPRDPEDQILRPWDEIADWKELGFRPQPPPEPEAKPKEKPNEKLNIDDYRG